MTDPTTGHVLTPFLCVTDCRAAIAWYAEALGAVLTDEPIEMEDGSVGHCELAVGDAAWMMSGEFPEVGVAAPATDRGAAVTLHLTVPDVDAAVDRVTAAGTPLTRGPEDTSHAGRIATFVDPFGHRWFLSTTG